MVVTLVHVWIKTGRERDFIEACKENHRKSTNEPGNLRFDILQDAADSSKFTLYEAYETEEAVLVHKTTAHYKKWRDTVADWMDKPREGVKHIVICPQDKTKW